MGLGLDARGRLLVTDMDCHVLMRLNADLDAFQIHTGSGHGWSEWQEVKPGNTRARPKRAPGSFNGPHSVQEDADGRLLVTCYYTPLIAALAPDDTLEVLAGPELLKGPATTRLDGKGRLLVAEYGLNLMLMLDGSGACIGRLGLDPVHGPLRLAPGIEGVTPSSHAGGFDRLHMAIAAPNGAMLVADTWNNRLQRFGPDGTYEACLNGSYGWRADAGSPHGRHLMDRPVSLDIDRHGRLLVTCWGSNEILLMGMDGKQQDLRGLPRLSKPYDARFMHDGIVVADTHNGRVLVVDNPFSRRVVVPTALQ
jgi:hypothetical protein